MPEREEEKRLYPGDKGYKGGVHYTTVWAGNQFKQVRTVTDSNGNPISVIVID